MKEQNKALLRRHFEELWNLGDLLVADEVYALEYLRHSSLLGETSGPESEKELVVLFRTAFSDLQVTLEGLVAEASHAAACWALCGKDTGGFQGRPPTQSEIQVSGIRLVKISNNKIVEGWEQLELVGLLSQLENVARIG